MLFLSDAEIQPGSLQDECCHVGCGSCEYWDPAADMENRTSRCRRLDHKHVQFAKPWFKSYDCGGSSAIMCADFKPRERCRYLKAHWTSPLDYAARGDSGKIKNANGGVWLCLDGDQGIRYQVTWWDFWNGTFIEQDGSLRWKQKQYYKRSWKSPIGYELVTERKESE